MKLHVLTIFLFISIIFLFISNIATAATINKPPLYLLSSNGLVGYWTMDGSKVNWATGAVTDSSGKGNTGTITNMATSTGVAIGKIGQALNFDGVDDYIAVGGSVTYATQNLPFSFSAWINLTDFSNSHPDIMQIKSDTTGPWHVLLSNSANYTGISIGSGDTWSRLKTDVIPSLGGWHHIAVVYNGAGAGTSANFKIYLDSTVQTTSDAGIYSTQAQNNQIGAAESAANQWKGLIDEVRVYNRALSANEVATLFNSGAAKFNVSPTKYLTDGLVGYWTMDGSRVNWATGAVTDSSGKGNTGTITNMATSTGVAIGKIGQALNFDGVDDIVLNNSPSAALSISSNITISVWLKSGNRGTGYISFLTKEATNDVAYNYIMEIISGSAGESRRLDFFYTGTGSNEWQSTNAVLPPNTWTHIAITHTFTNSSSMKMYINGIEVAGAWNPGGTEAPVTGLEEFGIGGLPTLGAQYFDGLLDEVRVYNRALSANEVATLYNSGAAKFNVSPTKYLTDGLVGYWTMDGSRVNWATGAVTDSSGKGNTGTITNMATSTGVAIGKIGQALNFDGVDDYVNAGAASSLDNLGPMTVSFWVNPVSQNTSDTFVAKGTAADNNLGWKVFSSGANGRFAFIVDYSGVGSSNLERRAPNNTFTLNKWDHAVVTWDGSMTATGILMYLNGAEVSSYSVTINAVGTRVDDNTENLAIGAANNGNDPFPGFIDEVRIYNRVLSANEVLQLYNAGR